MTNQRRRVDRRLSTYTHDDERLSGLPDPLRKAGPPDDVVAIWERDFYRAIAADREYWERHRRRLSDGDDL